MPLRLGYTAPLEPSNLFGHLVATAVPGVEEWRDGAYRRTVRLESGPAVIALTPRHDHVELDGPEEATEACRFLLDLDADSPTIDAALAADPVLAPLVSAAPGRRVPRTVDAHELALRAVLGQQVSTAAARTHTARIVADVGEPVDDPAGGLTHLFPTAAAVATVDPETLRMPRTRRATLLGLAAALADGLDVADAESLPGIGPWTMGVITMRALGDPDAFLPGDLGVNVALKELGLSTADADRWSPYRAYAVQYLWAMLPHAINTLPEPATKSDRPRTTRPF